VAKLFFHYSTMSAGKSLEIIKVAYNYEVQDKKVLILTSRLDNRHQVGKIWSRTGFEKEAATFNQATNLLEYVLQHKELPTTVLIDEAQFLTKKQVIELTKLVDNYRINVMSYGLKNDSFNELFEGSKYLLIYADNIKELKTECWYCHKKAIMNLRFNERGEPVYSGEQVDIGGNEKYLPVCRKCYHEVNHFKHPLNK